MMQGFVPLEDWYGKTQRYRHRGHEIVYRRGGAGEALLLLHGFPTSSHMFRNLIPRLATRYQVIAPDLPGFGSTVAPPRGEYDYTFDNLAHTISGFTEALKLSSFAIYVFDYGAPVGFRLADALGIARRQAQPAPARGGGGRRCQQQGRERGPEPTDEAHHRQGGQRAPAQRCPQAGTAGPIGKPSDVRRIAGAEVVAADRRANGQAALRAPSGHPQAGQLVAAAGAGQRMFDHRLVHSGPVYGRRLAPRPAPASNSIYAKGPRPSRVRENEVQAQGERPTYDRRPAAHRQSRCGSHQCAAGDLSVQAG